MIAQIVFFSRKTDAQRIRKILRFVPQKLRKSFANGITLAGFITCLLNEGRKANPINL